MDYITHYHGPHKAFDRTQGDYPQLIEGEELHAEYNGTHYWISGVRWSDGLTHEVMVFAANKDGTVADWYELYCERGTTDTRGVFETYITERLIA